MRELTKSMLRAPWAVSMFGVRQVVRSVDPRDGLRKSVADIDEVNDVLEDKLGETVGGLYRTGKHIQAGMVDALFDLAGGPWPGTEKALGQAWRAIDQGWSKVRRVTGNDS